MSVRLDSVTFSYPRERGMLSIFAPLSCEFRPGTVSVIVGPSGCGKTTLFNMIAGLEHPASGTIQRTSQRVGYVFQQPLLLPWLTVRQNAIMGAELSRTSGNGAAAFAEHLLRRYRLSEVVDAAPRSLSGGMQQRVAIIRAMVARPDILLLDEPFAHSDFAMRRVMHDDLSAMTDERQLTVLVATHDLHEAVLLADHVLLLGGTPTRVIDEFSIPVARAARLRSNSEAALSPFLDRLWASFDRATS